MAVAIKKTGTNSACPPTPGTVPKLMEEAIYLSKLATKVTVIHRRDSLRASKVMQDKAMSMPNISFLWNKEVIDINDVEQGKVTSLVLRDTQTGETSTIDVDGVFIGIGHTPNTALFKGQLAMHRLVTRKRI